MVIPIHDENPVRRTPVITYLIIAINLALFLVEPIQKLSLSGNPTTVGAYCQQVEFFDHYGAIPAELVHDRQLAPSQPVADTTAGPVACPVESFGKVPVLSVLTAMFLHGGLLHILGNMLFFFVFGNNIEDRLGRVRFLLFYLVSGYVAAYAYAFAFHGSHQPLIGASGAIAGVLGAYLVLFPRARVTTLVPFLLFLPFRLPAWLVLGFWFLVQWADSAAGTVARGANVAYFAHVAGFIFGAAVIRALIPRRKASP